MSLDRSTPDLAALGRNPRPFRLVLDGQEEGRGILRCAEAVRALMDVVAVASACPQDITSLNDRHLTDIELVVRST